MNERRVMIRRFALFIVSEQNGEVYLRLVLRPFFVKLYEFRDMEMVMGPEPRWWLCFFYAIAMQ